MSWRNIPEGRKAIRNENVSASMKRSTEARKCPACEKKGALAIKTKPNGEPVWKCRFCDHVKEILPA